MYFPFSFLICKNVSCYNKGHFCVLNSVELSFVKETDFSVLLPQQTVIKQWNLTSVPIHIYGYRSTAYSS